jgi:hypothetical protein
VHGVTLDGKALYEVVFPLFLKKFLQKVKVTPEFLVPYQEKSKERFEAEENKPNAKVLKRTKRLAHIKKPLVVSRPPVEEAPVVLLPSIAHNSSTLFQVVNEQEKVQEKVQEKAQETVQEKAQEKVQVQIKEVLECKEESSIVGFVETDDLEETQLPQLKR